MSKELSFLIYMRLTTMYKVISMKVKFIGEGSPLSLVKGKTYEVLAIEGNWYRIIDETGEDYCYHKNSFEIIEK